MKKTHKIKWVLFHSPVELFVRTATTFAAELHKLTDGRIDIEILKIDEYADKYNNGAWQDPVSLIKTGQIQMSQIQTNWLGMSNATDFFALDLPFLFKDHDHATRVLDGEIGQSMLASLPKTTEMRGLAFTYSGGYRCIASTRELFSADDLKGLTIAVRTNPVNVDMAQSFGAIPGTVNDLELETRKDMGREFDTVQTTLPRYESQIDSSVHPYVINTKHNMFLTTIIINDEFWNQLDAEDQAYMKQAALHSAKLERQWSVDDAQQIATDKSTQDRLGIKGVIDLPAAEISKLKAASEQVYAKYKPMFTEGLVDSILKA